MCLLSPDAHERVITPSLRFCLDHDMNHPGATHCISQPSSPKLIKLKRGTNQLCERIPNVCCDLHLEGWPKRNRVELTKWLGKAQMLPWLCIDPENTKLVVTHREQVGGEDEWDLEFALLVGPCLHGEEDLHQEFDFLAKQHPNWVTCFYNEKFSPNACEVPAHCTNLDSMSDTKLIGLAERTELRRRRWCPQIEKLRTGRDFNTFILNQRARHEGAMDEYERILCDPNRPSDFELDPEQKEFCDRASEQARKTHEVFSEFEKHARTFRNWERKRRSTSLGRKILKQPKMKKFVSSAT